ncbi:MAG: SufD family Fe-S cluster assembly protein [Alphaproteobacteria bacterium]|nr:SufD family Fe-S cluster assembly protein [Alphaproteobacteria bacterium]
MSHMWNEFNIKTFPAETIVFRNGKYLPESSTLKNTNIDCNYDKPVHIIYIGEISGENILDINITAQHQPIYLSMNIKNDTDAKIYLKINNHGENSEFRGHVMLENSKNLTFDCTGIHDCSNTTILLKAKLIANTNSISKLTGNSIISSNIENVINDIGFSAITTKNAKIEFNPTQHISSIPKSADHSASINNLSNFQIQFLHNSGLSNQEIDIIKREAFKNDFSLF